MLKAYGFPVDTILPELETDGMALLGDATLPASALVVLGSVIAHRREDPMPEDELIGFVDEGFKENSRGWERDFASYCPVNRSGWTMIWNKDDTAGRGDAGVLARRIQGLQENLNALTYGWPQGGAKRPFYPESVRVTYEDLEANPGPHVLMTHRVFQAYSGYHDIILNDEDLVVKVHQDVADFLQVPAASLALARVRSENPEAMNWIVAGEIFARNAGKALVLVDTAIPMAHWLQELCELNDLKTTYLDSHGAPPDIITLNGTLVEDFPITLESGDFLRLRWDNHSDHEWEDIDIFKKFDAPAVVPPGSPPPEEDESSQGGPTEDPPLDDTQLATDDDNAAPDPDVVSLLRQPLL